MYDNSNDWVKPCEQYEKGVPLRYDKLLKSLPMSHRWQQVRMDILYIPKMEDGHHLLVVSREYLSGWADAEPVE
jgi:hypothetical protein